ncbi:MAG: YebC/PmpR family DNA-binding transcriptional regulator [Phycisphaeraceae bacterium]|nr:MAG: YebC/PmpR family DNA-binding transcriptional regulator [Phycisphaeraceae bacterium]
MAGHSKWANIRHKKARVDAQRGKVWTKCSRAIMVAARTGGADPASNLSLRYAIDEARAANMPKDTIQRAIDKGAGTGDDAVNFEAIRYEGYGPSGVAIMVDVLTDNRARTAPEMREIFSRGGGNLGTTGSVGYMFEARGVITVDAAKTTEDQIMNLAIEAGALDCTLEDDTWTIATSPTDFITVKDAIDNAGLEATSAELTMEPTVMAGAAGDDVAKILRLLERLEDHDDVQKVYTNMDASDADLAAASG